MATPTVADLVARIDALEAELKAIKAAQPVQLDADAVVPGDVKKRHPRQFARDAAYALRNCGHKSAFIKADGADAFVVTKIEGAPTAPFDAAGLMTYVKQVRSQVQACAF